MASSRIMTGARAKLGIYNPATDTVDVVGIFNNVSYGLTYDAQPAYILGRYGPAEIDYTSQEPVSITASGWRVIGHGPHADGRVPKLQDLLTHQYISLALIDRQGEAAGGDGRMARFENVRPTGYTTTISARQLEEITVTFMAMLVSDESATNAESPTSTFLPST